MASTAKNFLLIDLGLAVAFPTIVIPVLRGLQNEKNPNETLFFTPAQASWFGKKEVKKNTRYFKKKQVHNLMCI